MAGDARGEPPFLRLAIRAIGRPAVTGGCADDPHRVAVVCPQPLVALPAGGEQLLDALREFFEAWPVRRGRRRRLPLHRTHTWLADNPRGGRARSRARCRITKWETRLNPGETARQNYGKNNFSVSAFARCSSEPRKGTCVASCRDMRDVLEKRRERRAMVSANAHDLTALEMNGVVTGMVNRPSRRPHRSSWRRVGFRRRASWRQVAAPPSSIAHGLPALRGRRG